jgi:hypothetical protein
MANSDTELRLLDDGRIISEAAYQREEVGGNQAGRAALNIGVPVARPIRLIGGALSAIALFWWMRSAGTTDSTGTLIVLASIAGIIIALLPQFCVLLAVCEVITHKLNGPETPDGLVSAEGIFLALGVYVVLLMGVLFFRARSAM